MQSVSSRRAIHAYEGVIKPAANCNNPIVEWNKEVSCNWHVLCEQLLSQWDRITPAELENTGHNRLHVARLIQMKYGISVEMAVNYLRNFERTLPLLGCA